MSRHLDSHTIFRYVSNRMTPQDETSVQEHISECSKCRAAVERYRALAAGLEPEASRVQPRFRLICKSTLFRVAASLIIVAGITFTIINTRPKSLPIQGGHDSGAILSTDTYQPETYQPGTQKADTIGTESDTLATAPVYYTPEK